jgi:rhamnose utilization protein RhaD (predicted bifunctional aldolase and dehydrogenase)
MSVEKEVKDFCQSIGCDPLLVQGAGGNVSWKDGEVLWVKASGKWLAEAGKREIFVPVDLTAMREAIEVGNFDLAPKSLAGNALRPSIETYLHAVMPHQIVVHLHPVDILSYLVCSDAEERIGRLMCEKYFWIYVEYCKPGAELARITSRGLCRRPNTNLVFLENHGVVLGGKDISEVDVLLRELLLIFSKEPTNLSEEARLPMAATQESSGHFMAIDDLEICRLVFEDRYFNRLKQAWALYPDHVVFLGAKAECYDNIDVWKKELQSSKQSAEVVFVKGCGVFVAKDLSRAKRVQLRCYFDVVTRLGDGDKVRSLSSSQIADLLGWEAENYRQGLAKSV